MLLESETIVADWDLRQKYSSTADMIAAPMDEPRLVRQPRQPQWT